MPRFNLWFAVAIAGGIVAGLCLWFDPLARIAAAAAITYAAAWAIPRLCFAAFSLGLRLENCKRKPPE